MFKNKAAVETPKAALEHRLSEYFNVNREHMYTFAAPNSSRKTYSGSRGKTNGNSATSSADSRRSEV